MNVLNQIRDGATSLLETLNEGWGKLMAKSGRAVTRFTRTEPTGSADGGSKETESWGFLAGQVAETSGHVTVQLEAPGMNREDFDISIDGRTLVIRGEKRLLQEEGQPDFYLFEAAYGSFERVLTLPREVEPEGAEATYARGILTVRLRKSKAGPVHRIRVS